LLLPEGRRLRAADVAAMAAAGQTAASVRKKALVLILPTDDEVRPVGTEPGPGVAARPGHPVVLGMVGQTPVPGARDGPSTAPNGSARRGGIVVGDKARTGLLGVIPSGPLA